MPMNRISRFVVWICSRFDREHIELIVKELTDVLKSQKDLPSKPKEAFKEQHPRYRDFYVDPTPPLTSAQTCQESRRRTCPTDGKMPLL